MNRETRNVRVFCGASGLLLLTLAGIVSAYQVLFSLWMTAYPLANIHSWRAHFYFRLVQTLLIAFAWIVLAVWLIRSQHKDQPSPSVP